MRNPSGFCGMSSVSKSDFAFTVAASRLSATIEIRSSVACALSLGLVRKNSTVKSPKGNLDGPRQAFAIGANDYLVKLPDKIELIARIRYHSRAFLNQLQRDASNPDASNSSRSPTTTSFRAGTISST